jgi:hypothetical protein
VREASALALQWRQKCLGRNVGAGKVRRKFADIPDVSVKDQRMAGCSSSIFIAALTLTFDRWSHRHAGGGRHPQFSLLHTAKSQSAGLRSPCL